MRNAEKYLKKLLEKVEKEIYNYKKNINGGILNLFERNTNDKVFELFLLNELLHALKYQYEKIVAEKEHIQNIDYELIYKEFAENYNFCEKVIEDWYNADFDITEKEILSQLEYYTLNAKELRETENPTSKGGRLLYNQMTDNDIIEYLGLNDTINDLQTVEQENEIAEIIKESRSLENTYATNDSLDYCLKGDFFQVVGTENVNIKANLEFVVAFEH